MKVRRTLLGLTMLGATSAGMLAVAAPAANATGTPALAMYNPCAGPFPPPTCPPVHPPTWPVNLNDGSVLREISSAPVYVIYGGAKFWIPTTDVLNRLYGGWGNVKLVADGALTSVPTTPRTGTILQEDGQARVWRIEGATKRWITSPDVLARYGGWGVVHVVPAGDTAGFPRGATHLVSTD